MHLNVLCIGDVVGKPGRELLQRAVPLLVQTRQIDFVLANVENAAGGSGLTPKLYAEINGCGVHAMTLGDHAYKKREIYSVLGSADNIVRPANLPASAAGRAYAVLPTSKGVNVGFCCLLGRMYMNLPADNPFACVDRLLATMGAAATIKIVDFHAEATSEKVAMGWHLDGRASICCGTHTHVPTADARVLPCGTAYVSDLGMTGPYNSILGRDKGRVLKHLTTGMPYPFDVASGDLRLCGLLARVNTESGLAEHCEPIQLKASDLPPSAPGPGA